MPVEAEVAAQLHAGFAGPASPCPRRGEERVERGLEVALLGDPALHGADLIVPSMPSRISRPTAAYRAHV